MGLLSKFSKQAETDALVLAQRLGADVRDFFSTLLSDLEEANGHAQVAAAEADALIESATERKTAALAEAAANEKLTKGLRSLVG